MTSARENSLLADLNDPQRQAVTHIDGPLLVVAGPGSGKTRVITRRCAYLVGAGVQARNVLAITFTNKAADEMRKRCEALGVARGMWVYTFHALGARLLREFGPLAQVEPGFSIYDVPDQLRLIKQAMELSHVSEGQIEPSYAQAEISDAKSKLLSVAAYSDRADWHEKRTVARIYDAYEKLLRQNNAVDFDDLLMRVATVLRDHPDVAERLNVRFRYVMIDEYQDTNHAQYLIARFLSQHHRNLCVTGDPDQSIYGWRGADIRNILEFERDFPDAKVVRLEENYRSTGNILKVASALIANNRRRKQKDIWTRNGDGTQVEIWRHSTGVDEAERVADAIARERETGAAWHDFAICYRVNAISRGLEEALRARGIPYRIARGVEFYNRKEIKDTVAYLRLLVNPADDVALLRVINTPARGIGKTTIERLLSAAAGLRLTLFEACRRAGEFQELQSVAAKVAPFVRVMDRLAGHLNDPLPEVVSAVLSISGLEAALKKERDEDVEGEDRVANVAELVTAAARFADENPEGTLADFLHRASLTGDQDAIDEKSGAVQLLTLHAAKGLEFPVVFMVGVEQGMLPHERALSLKGDVEEERRLCFVGITRAQRRLVLTHADERIIRGIPQGQIRSQFLREVVSPAVVEQDFSEMRPWGRRRDDGLDGPHFVPTDDSGAPRRSIASEWFGGDTEAVRDVSADDEFSPPPRGAQHRPGPVSSSDAATEADSDARLPRALRPKRKWRAGESADDVPTIQFGETPKPPPPADSDRFKDWKEGTLVQHAKYGVGQIRWIRPGSGQTRAAIKFAGSGERTFILELAPIVKLK